MINYYNIMMYYFSIAPDSPEIDVIPTYSYNNKTLLRLTTRFNETVRPKASNLLLITILFNRKHSTSLIG